MLKPVLCAVCLITVGRTAPLTAETFTLSGPAALAARHWRTLHERATIDEFVALLAIPNVAADQVNNRRNAEAIAKMLERRTVAPKLVTVPGAKPVVYGEKERPARSVPWFSMRTTTANRSMPRNGPHILSRRRCATGRSPKTDRASRSRRRASHLISEWRLLRAVRGG